MTKQPKELTYENIESDNACEEGLAFAKRFFAIENREEAIEMLWRDHKSYAEWCISNGYDVLSPVTDLMRDRLGWEINASTTGNRANASTTGNGAVSAVLGFSGRVQAGEKGAIVATWWDEAAKRPRVIVGYSGEDGIEAGVWYYAKLGKFERDLELSPIVEVPCATKKEVEE